MSEEHFVIFSHLLINLFTLGAGVISLSASCFFRHKNASETESFSFWSGLLVALASMIVFIGKSSDYAKMLYWLLN